MGHMSSQTVGTCPLSDVLNVLINVSLKKRLYVLGNVWRSGRYGLLVGFEVNIRDGSRGRTPRGHIHPITPPRD